MNIFSNRVKAVDCTCIGNEQKTEKGKQRHSETLRGYAITSKRTIFCDYEGSRKNEEREPGLHESCTEMESDIKKRHIDR